MDDKLARVLYGPDVYKELHLPARVFADGGASYGMAGVVHAPGNGGFYGPHLPTDKPFHGYLGVMVQTYAAPITSQCVELCWACVDIDADDNPHLHTAKLRKKVISEFQDEAVVRTSKGGCGLHILFPIFRNQGCERPEVTVWTAAKAKGKQFVQTHMMRLLANGVNPCVSGLHNMWITSQGGKQETLHIPEKWNAEQARI